MRNFKAVCCACALWTVAAQAAGQTKMPPAWQSSFVHITEDGKLTYIPDAEGNTLPDFSRVGYRHGEVSVPDYPVTEVVYPVVDGDSGAAVQQAVDRVSRRRPGRDGHRGVVLLKRGTYRIAGTIEIAASGVVLRGEGDNANETRLVATGREKRPLIRVAGTGRAEEVPGTRVRITDDFVPVGAFSFRVASTAGFEPGDRVILFRPGRQEWISAIRMDRIVERKGTRQWQPEEYNLAFERRIEKIEGDRVFLDNPVVMQMRAEYGGGELYKYTYDGRIGEAGVENLCLESEYEDYEDVDHGWIGVQFDHIENGWVRNLTARYFGYAAVSLEQGAKNITVKDCKSLEPKAVITGGLRYSFNNCGQQNLVMNCMATEGRHDYVTGAKVLGPNVFYNCTASQTYADIGPHHRWSCGTLYDNIVTDGEINVQDRGNMGSGHGWAGVTQVLWNCRARRAAVQNPWASGYNYNIGMKGAKYPGHFKDRPEGFWEGQGETNLVPRSLYMAQLMARQADADLTILTK